MWITPDKILYFFFFEIPCFFIAIPEHWVKYLILILITQTYISTLQFHRYKYLSENRKSLNFENDCMVYFNNNFDHLRCSAEIMIMRSWSQEPHIKISRREYKIGNKKNSSTKKEYQCIPHRHRMWPRDIRISASRFKS